MTEENNSESVVVKPRELFSDVILTENSDELAKFMDQPLSAIAETMTGWLAAGPKAWMMMTGHIVQAILKAKLFQQVSQEIKELREKGKIADDFAEKRNGGQSWVALFRIIDEETPDAEKLDALKAMFYAVNKIGIEDSERILNYQLFQIAKQLTSGQLLLLKAVYESYERREFSTPSVQVEIHEWANKIAFHLGHKLSYLVLKEEPILVEKGLMEPRIAPSASWLTTGSGRITDLGIHFCENLQTYHVMKTEMEQDSEA